ncbi:MAG: beta-propeller domain-containing protein [Candidatus Bathyarchaeota archaeon]|nr:beta-propeller domain-containing protein [Candidatus Bathyarchaeota archaeon]
MVQQEVKKKTSMYGLAAVLSAIVLVALIYTYGTTPAMFPPTETPYVANMKTFSSYEELRDYLVANSAGISVYPYWARSDTQYALAVPAPITKSGEAATNGYSTTNIQVAGVDEADIVKTDGKYIYVAATTYGYPEPQSAIYILKADPQDPKVIAKITLENYTYPEGLYLSEDSSRLVVIANRYQPVIFRSDGPETLIYPGPISGSTFLYVYDISDKAYPLLARNLSISGGYFSSRMIGNYVYVVINQPAYVLNDTVTLPVLYQEKKVTPIAPSSVYYSDTVDRYFTFTSFIAVNILDDAQQPTNLTVLMGGTSVMYVSTSNIYVTYSTWNEGQYTAIYRVRINGATLTFEAKGSVPGYVLNQYSMDEYNGNFRIATTSQNEKTQTNNVYVLDKSLAIVGKLEGLAEDERIYAVRFMGDKGYVVTFRQVDPFFVIDLRNPTAPKVAGELKIPGYSSYLHLFDANHVIGLGKENNTVKLSLFDVTNVNDPKEIAKYIVEGEWTDSEALYEPKAFLFNREKELLVIPISVNNYGVVDSGSKDSGTQAYYFQGAYVFKVTLADGFELRGNVTHQPQTDMGVEGDWGVRRALYIGNTLYTVSNAKVQLNSLDTLAFIAEIKLS